MRQIHEGMQVKVYDRGDGTAWKQFTGPLGGSLMKLESFVMEYMRLMGFPAPEVLERVTAGYAMPYVSGGDLLSSIEEGTCSLAVAARLMGELHARMHQVKAPPRVGRLRERLLSDLRAWSRLAEPVKQSVLQVLAELPDGQQICHGDYHPGNLLPSGDTCLVIDWVGAEVGDPLADVARTRVLLRYGLVRQLSPALLESDSMMRRQFADLYLAHYRSVRDVDAAALAKWELVRAAEMFAKQEPCDQEALAAELVVL